MDTISTPHSSTATLVAALRALARDIKSEDGVANAAIAEAAERLVELDRVAQGCISASARKDIEARLVRDIIEVGVNEAFVSSSDFDYESVFTDWAKKVRYRIEGLERRAELAEKFHQVAVAERNYERAVNNSDKS